MSDEPWRPLGVDSEDEVAAYDALHDGVPEWIESAFWSWVRGSLTLYSTYSDGSGRYPTLDAELAQRMCQVLQIALPEFPKRGLSTSDLAKQVAAAVSVLRRDSQPLRIADYLLAHDGHGDSDALNELLTRGKSAWAIGIRSARPGLVLRVPTGVQVAADAVMARAGRAGVRLAKAWEQLYGLSPDASQAYSLAIKAVEDAAIPVVSPTNANATLGTVLRQMEDQGDWSLPMGRKHPDAPTGGVLVSMMRMLWHGQHDRHGGQPSAPGDVSMEEATVAVGLAVTLVQWFDAGLVNRSARASG